MKTYFLELIGGLILFALFPGASLFIIASLIILGAFSFSVWQEHEELKYWEKDYEKNQGLNY